jgi:hypothetical protein
MQIDSLDPGACALGHRFPDSVCCCCAGPSTPREWHARVQRGKNNNASIRLLYTGPIISDQSRQQYRQNRAQVGAHARWRCTPT